MLRILFLTVSCSCILSWGAVDKNEEMDVFRLPNNTEPLSYDLIIKPKIDPDNNIFEFTGDVTIKIRAKESTEKLTLNVDGLNINQIQITDNSSLTPVEVIKHNLVVKNQQLEIQLKQPGLIANLEYIVKITYSGNLRDDMTGFYKSSYLDKSTNKIKWLAITQFEPTYARRAFPCYDEPAYKTPFKIYIERKDTEISISNTPKENKFPVSTDQYIRDQYETSKPMSTYLVAFSVSEFTFITKEEKVYIYTHSDYIDQLSFIKEKANKLLNLMEIYTNIPYEYAKINLLAIPDFSFGAMENWGLNTYREEYLLVSDKSREKDKELVTTVVQHELSHQWFGDLVTCSWWNYVWLNEAFATLFEYFAVQVAEPDWRIDDMFVIEQHQTALSYDHRPRHPITASVNTPDEIEDIFDKITYNKGASVLRMLKHALNDEIFRSSLMIYLETYKYKSVEPKNLWDSFDYVLFDLDSKNKLGFLGENITIGEFMRSWTDQAGYPVINVQTNNDNSLIITQKRFQVDEPKVDDTTLWNIGLTYTTQKSIQFQNLQPSVWMNNTEVEIKIPLNEDAGWVLFNLQSTGFYRVNYDSRNWLNLINQLKLDPKCIHVLNRAQLIDDSFNLARAGELPYSIPFTLVEYLAKEDDFIPWYSVLNSLSFLVERMRYCPHTGSQTKTFAKLYAEMAYNKVSNLYKKKDSKHLTKTSMSAFSNWACKLEVDACVQSAIKYFNEWQINKTEIPPDVKQTVLCVGVKNGTENTWNSVFELFKNTISASEREAALLALACSTDTTILSKYLNLLLQTNCPIRPQDYATVFKSLTSTPAGINVTTNFLQTNINQSLNSMWKGKDMIELMFSNLASSVSTKKEIDELNSVRILTYLTPELKESFNTFYKEVELNYAYFKRSHPLLHSWFSPEKSTPSSAISNSYINAIVLSFLYLGVILFNNNDLLVN